MADQIDLLIIDDDPNIIEILTIMFSDYTINIKLFNDAKEALAQLQNYTPQVIFINYSMPIMNADKFIIKMSEKCLFRGASIYLITDVDFNSSQKLQLQTLGFNDIIKKPFVKNDVFTALSETIDLKLKKIRA
jgi:CheY-like chemotaxis protein